MTVSAPSLSLPLPLFLSFVMWSKLREAYRDRLFAMDRSREQANRSLQSRRYSLGSHFYRSRMDHGPRYGILLLWLTTVRLPPSLPLVLLLTSLCRQKNALSMIFLSMTTIAVVSFQVPSFLSLTPVHRLRAFTVVLLGFLPHIQ